jgi:3-oxoacyl-[acyl-carrier protein] reductase
VERQGKVAIVTGSGRGLGREYSIGFSQEGFRVVIAEIDIASAKNVESEIREQGGEALAIRTDVSDETSVQSMVKKTYDCFGRIDILVNNAAYPSGSPPITPAEELKVEEWDKILRVNVTGAWICCKSVFPYMKQQMGGKIINISSDTVWLGYPGLLHYCSSKGAVVAMTRALAAEWGKYNINVNCVAPGLMTTEVVLEKIKRAPEEKDLVMSRQSIKRLGRPKDPVGCVLFLSSEKSNFITGQTIFVNGGLIFH